MSQVSTFYSVQYLRFVAATIVVLVHISHSLSAHLGSPTAGIFTPGITGVDIFFVISGFIMYVISRRTNRGPVEFFLLRFTRIAPPYWVVTSAMLAIMLVRPDLFFTSEFDWKHAAASYLFIPWQHSGPFIKPILHVGWTLNLEFLFYSLVALMLWPRLQANTRFWGSVIVISLFPILGYVLQPTHPIPVVWSSPVMVEFAFGLLVGRLYFSSLRLPVWLSLLMIAAGCVFLGQIDQLMSAQDATRWLTAGLPAVLLVWGAPELEKAGRVGKNETFRFLGDISFALYLCHYFAIGLTRAVWPKSMIGGYGNDIGFYAAALALSFLGATLFYLLIEKPSVKLTQGWVKRVFRRPSAPTQQART